jgi:hypothetical protein
MTRRSPWLCSAHLWLRHTRKREAQTLFTECNDILTKERKAPSTRSILTGESKAHEQQQSSLQHKGLSKPVIPSGTRRDPTERSFHHPGVVVDEAPAGEEEDTEQEAATPASFPERYSQSQLHTPPPPQKLSHGHSHSTPSPNPTPPGDQSSLKKKKSWGSYLFGSKKSPPAAASAATPEQSKSSTKVTSSNSAVAGDGRPSGGPNDASHGQETETEEEEDTPMNRAYQERILREERRLEEEEDRHRLGGAYVSERPEEGDDHYHEKRNRRRPPSGGVTNQRRPKPLTKPIPTQPEPPQPFQPQPIPQQQQAAYSPPPQDSQPSLSSSSSSYHNPSYLHNLTQQKLSGQLNAAVRSRAKSDVAPTSAPEPSSHFPEKAPAPMRATAAPTERAEAKVPTPVAATASQSAPPVHSSREAAPKSEAEPLPEGWEEVYTEDGTRYYYHKVTRMSRLVSTVHPHLPRSSLPSPFRWERPSPEVAAAVENRLNLSQKQIDESIEVPTRPSLRPSLDEQKKRREREQKRVEEEQNSLAAQALQVRPSSPPPLPSLPSPCLLLVADEDRQVSARLANSPWLWEGAILWRDADPAAVPTRPSDLPPRLHHRHAPHRLLPTRRHQEGLHEGRPLRPSRQDPRSPLPPPSSLSSHGLSRCLSQGMPSWR